jgi:hypothetical protein
MLIVMMMELTANIVTMKTIRAIFTITAFVGTGAKIFSPEK